ncbi:Cytochrome P450 107B1 [Pseudoalteromonas holothuriae]|uniref:Cytochrome P450 107B1 n=1 Tax=Pseudoalteromonas holothuriae TaxID=2963714 RepID=A0A9W4VW78_9GAMM|nr:MULTISPECIES: cytochrome P450 [unclassified Pseudoalteromonas]CAH9067184.1 Cytochrome P450 107B1 [Pseudoalteromonas sp. CIP111854]CAH9068238.1 Cytochrome P450 107B1 [Pseudoalteromonas sp. CIP111951]
MMKLSQEKNRVFMETQAIYNRYKMFREKMPVYPFKTPNGEVIYFVSKYEDVVQAMKDKRLSKVNPNTLGKDMLIKKYPFTKKFDRRIQDLDPPEHTRLRKMVSSMFQGKGIKDIESDIRKTVVELLNDLPNKNSVDIVQHFCIPFPIIVISKILGFPANDFEQISEWSHAMAPLLDGSLGNGAIAGFKAFEELTVYLEWLIEEKRKNPANDLTSLLVNVNGEQSLTENEIFSMVEIVMNAAHMTTSNLLSNGLFLLLTHPEAYERLTWDSALLPDAIEEMLRFESPVQAIDYYTKEPIEIAGRRIEKDKHLALLIGSANRDEAIFEHPEVFDITRSHNKHITFGGGIHLCLGALLARTEAKIAFDVLLTRYPKMRIIGPQPSYRDGYNLRGISNLHVSLY